MEIFGMRVAFCIQMDSGKDANPQWLDLQSSFYPVLWTNSSLFLGFLHAVVLSTTVEELERHNEHTIII